MDVTAKQLNEALNLIMGYTSNNLPSGWCIRIGIERNDASMDLYDPNDECVSTDWDGEQRTIKEMVNFANEYDQR